MSRRLSRTPSKDVEEMKEESLRSGDSAVTRVVESSEKDKSAASTAKRSIGRQQSSEEKKAPTRTRRFSFAKSSKPEAADSDKSTKKPAYKASTPAKPAITVPKITPKKEKEQGAIPKVTSQTTRKSLSSSSSSRSLSKIKDEGVDKPTSGGSSRKASQLTGKPLVKSKKSKYPEEPDPRIPQRFPKEVEDKPPERILGPVAESGLFKKRDSCKVSGTDPQSQPSEESSSSEEESVLRDLAVDFLTFQRDNLDYLMAKESHFRVNYEEMEAALQQGERISRNIRRLSKTVPETESEIRMENDKLNYFITVSAGIFKRIDDQFELLKNELDQYTSLITTTNEGIDLRLTNLLRVVYKMSVYGNYALEVTEVKVPKIA